MSYRQFCANFVHFYALILLHLTLVVPLPRLAWQTTLLRCVWIAWLIVPATQILFSVVTDAFEKVSYMVGKLLFAFSILTNVVTFIEAMLKEKQRQQFLHLELEVDALLCKQVDISQIQMRVRVRAFYALILQITYDIVQLAIAATAYRSEVFYYAVPLTVIQRMRYIQIALTIIRQTERSACMIEALNVLGRANLPKYKYTNGIWQPYTVWEYERLNALRLIQGLLCELHQGVSDCFGCSIIVLLFTTFFTVVSNIFWCIITLRQNVKPMKVAYNMMTMLRLSNLAATLLIHGDRARKNHATISGLIYKLAKPFGNKTYNDLVSSFSLQCLQEELSLCVKGFFTLDIPLLGNMIALTVTYLIILVQFMASEEEIKKETLDSTFMSNKTKV